MYDIILKKRGGAALNRSEISFFVDGYTKGTIPDYQMSALLMAIYFRGMDDAETAVLTDCMAHSGDMCDLGAINGVKADKHSTGGVGDKTTLVVAPIVAACGVRVAKMSGRGLGHTGGTIDKLESIQGLHTDIPREQFISIVNKIGLCVIGQSGNLAPADKKMYALRDVTATVDNTALIAASIMSKKLAAGSDCIMLDVKTGSGAFMKTFDDSLKLAQTMVNIGEKNGRRTAALITNMNRPLGRAIGNSLEVIEAVDTLCGHGPDDVTKLCEALAGGMLALAGRGSLDDCKKMARRAVTDGSALLKLREMVAAQGGDAKFIDDTDKFAKAEFSRAVAATRDGFIGAIDTQMCGTASVVLGAGRAVKDDAIDYAAGIVLCANTGDCVRKGQTIATLYAKRKERLAGAEDLFQAAVEIEDKKPPVQPLIYAHVNKDGVRRFF